MNNQEQWLIDGECELCRKQKYCGTKCKKALQRTNNENIKAMKFLKEFLKSKE